MEKEKSVFSSIKRNSVVENIVEGFKQALIRGDLKPGQRLSSESDLAAEFGVGRSAVREAMKVLEGIGVVTIQQGDGTRIVDRPLPVQLSPLVFAIMLQAGMNNELLELRNLIQVGYCQLASLNATPEDLKGIRTALLNFEHMAHSNSVDMDQLTQADLDFHYAILDSTHNSLLIMIGRTVEELFFASIRKTISKTEGLSWGMEGHRCIYQALLEKDMEKIRLAVLASLERWGKELDIRPSDS